MATTDLEKSEASLNSAREKLRTKKDKVSRPASAKVRSSVSTATKRGTAPAVVAAKDAGKKKPVRVTVRWADKEKKFLTDRIVDALLTHASYRQAFGLDKCGEFATSSGLKPLDFACKIAETTFHDQPEYKDKPLKSLGGVVLTRINNLKKTHTEHKNKLSSTGYGLVADGREAELNGDLANVYEHIKISFPWFAQMTIMLRRSPSFNSTAISNSNSTVDLSPLKTKKTTSAPLSDDSDSDSDSDDADLSGKDKDDVSDIESIKTAELPDELQIAALDPLSPRPRQTTPRAWSTSPLGIRSPLTGSPNRKRATSRHHGKGQESAFDIAADNDVAVDDEENETELAGVRSPRRGRKRRSSVSESGSRKAPKGPAPLPAPAFTAPSSSAPAGPGRQKRDFFSQLNERAAEDRKARVDMWGIQKEADIQQKSDKRRLKLEREKLKVEEKRMRLEYKAVEADKQRAHELAMLERRIQAGEFSAGPSSQNSNPFPPPPPGSHQFNLDPRLRY